MSYKAVLRQEMFWVLSNGIAPSVPIIQSLEHLCTIVKLINCRNFVKEHLRCSIGCFSFLKRKIMLCLKVTDLMRSALSPKIYNILTK